MTPPPTSDEKIFATREDVAARMEPRRSTGTFVFTNGCFDILHVGHVSYLERARSLGDALIVGINSDASVRGLGKEPGRPVNSEKDRARVVAALACVDCVVIFDEDTPLETLALLRPDVHCKGGDYRADELPETPLVRSYGGRVEIIPFVPGYSTTGILARAKSAPPGKKEFKAERS